MRTDLEKECIEDVVKDSDYDRGESLCHPTHSHEYEVFLDFHINESVEKSAGILVQIQFDTRFEYDDINDWYELDINVLQMMLGETRVDVGALLSDPDFYAHIEDVCADYIKAEYGVTIQ